MSRAPLARPVPGVSQGSRLWVLKGVLAGPARQERRTRVLRVLKVLQVLRVLQDLVESKGLWVPRAPQG
jgi:hypothetical protein